MGSTESQPQNTAEPSAAPPGQFDESTGALSGIVTDSEFVPIGGASLAIREQQAARAVSATDGSFSFSRLEPGTYTIDAGKLGYTSSSVRADVIAGQEVAGIKITLEALAVVESRAVVYQFHGHVACSIGAFGLLSEECGQGLQTSQGTFGANPNNKIDWKFDLADLETLQSVYLELTWQPASAAAQQLAFNVAHGFKCTPGCESDELYCDAFENYGRPIQDCEILADDDLGKAKAPWDITARAWGAPVGPTEVPNIVLEQPFDMWRTEFFGEPMAEGYSAIKDS